MSEMQTLNKTRRGRPRLVARLLIGVNIALVIILGAFMVRDYEVTYRAMMQEKHNDLENEASALLPSVVRLRSAGPEVVESFIDEVAGAMREKNSPGHRIVAILGNTVAQPHARGMASPAILKAMENGADAEDGVGRYADTALVVGNASRGDVTVYVSEDLSYIQSVAKSRRPARLATIVLVGVSLALVLNIVLRRLLNKPLGRMVATVQRFSAGDLSARMPPATTEELATLSDEFDRMAADLERAQVERVARMGRARSIQEKLRPEALHSSGLRFAAVFKPAAEVAGDYYDVLPLRQGGLLLCLADVSGHDVPAAMGAAMLKALLQSASEHHSEPGPLLAELNRAFCRVALEDDFATMVLLHYDPASAHLEWASAGHEPWLLLRRDGHLEHLTDGGPPIGLDEEMEWETHRVDVQPGDRCVLLSDGVCETLNASGQPFGRERIEQTLAGRTGTPREIAEALQQQVEAFRAGHVQEDDVTILIAEFGNHNG